MGLALPKPEMDDGVGGGNESAERVLPASYAGSIRFPESGWNWPRFRFGVAGDFWSTLSPLFRRTLACCVILGVLASFCAGVNLWSISTRAQLERARYSYSTLDSRISELKSVGPVHPGQDYRYIPEPGG